MTRRECDGREFWGGALPSFATQRRPTATVQDDDIFSTEAAAVPNVFPVRLKILTMR
jgi:hypothetical protein